MDAWNCIMNKVTMTILLGSNIYSELSENKDATGPDGRRSTLGISINRQNPDTLLPAIPLTHKVICIDHAASRIAEKLINVTLTVLMELYSTQPDEAVVRVKNFCCNLQERDVHQAHRIEIVGGKLKVIIRKPF